MQYLLGEEQPELAPPPTPSTVGPSSPMPAPIRCSSGALSLSKASSGELGSCCFICLDGPSEEKGELYAPCTCARISGRLVHHRCLARWQLQSAGTKREKQCDFCGNELPDWRQSLTPPTGAEAPAIMNVNFGGVTYSFEVKPGPEGYKEFTGAIRRAFALPNDAELNITFTCDEPSSGESSGGSLLTLQGAGAYDAAVHCAAVSAAKRGAQGGSSSKGSAASSSNGSPASSSSGRRSSRGCLSPMGSDAEGGWSERGHDGDGDTPMGEAAQGAAGPGPGGNSRGDGVFGAAGLGRRPGQSRRYRPATSYDNVASGTGRGSGAAMYDTGSGGVSGPARPATAAGRGSGQEGGASGEGAGLSSTVRYRRSMQGLGGGATGAAGGEAGEGGDKASRLLQALGRRLRSALNELFA